MSPQEALSQLLDKRDLSDEQMHALMKRIMGGEATPAQIGGILIALRVKGETVTEIAAAARVMRELCLRVEVEDRTHLVDTCGTGGDACQTFNISTASALVAAAAGARVAKHGGRSVSSTCGSADVLEALGVNLGLPPERVAQCIAEVGVGFMFAPSHHNAMKHAAPVRRELGVRTMFNVLGPLTNPANAENQVIGVFHADLVAKFAQVLRVLGSRHVLVVHGADGIDEISLGGETRVAELKGGYISEYTLNPSRFGFAPAPVAGITVKNRDEAAGMLRGVLENKAGPARDIVCLNAGAAIYVAGVAVSLEEGVQRADAVIASGAAKQTLGALIAFTQRGG